ncbi:MAG TPA: NIPSNAP family protein [Candidatus Limnocylindrales bacterium]|nr:NIPSNAP family protein [Candidatus Limnocylindrales bacterium]
MIHELRTYTLKPGTQGEYLKHSGEVGRKIRGNDYGKLEGYWFTEFGSLNQLVHLWSFADLNERERLRAELGKNEAWNKEYVPKIRPILLAQENKILSAALPLVPPTTTGNVYELRWYRAHVGQANAWLDLIKGVMPVVDRHMKRVGLWQTQIAQLNEVVHLWVYRDLNERAAARAKRGEEPEWQAFLAKSAPLLAHMQSVILIPTAFSPMK